ncbi:MAG TPA: FHA domain-containing protein [Bryobacteraceae bacterium]|nr:FHA domain-containing protein [Bryobacteraceae bacterium]
MSFFAEVEKTIERTFRKWTERAFGPAQSDELLVVHRGILEEIESKIQVVQRGQRLFPYNYLKVTLVSQEPERRALFQAAFAQEHRLENDIREALQGAGCAIPNGFAVDVATADEGARGFEIEYAIREVTAAAQPVPPSEPPPPARLAARACLVAVRGSTAQASYTIDKARTNIGRMPELTDSQQRVVRRNEVVFEEGADEANATVSRGHAHVRFDAAAGEYRICDDESEYGTRVFREGRSIEVPAGNRRGERLRDGDEIYLGKACLRFELAKPD